MINSIKPFTSFEYNKTRSSVYKANVCDGLPRHEHTFAHTTVCIQGSIVVRKENKELTLNAYSNPLLLTANEWHEIYALEPNTIFLNQYPVGMEE